MPVVPREIMHIGLNSAVMMPQPLAYHHTIFNLLFLFLYYFSRECFYSSSLKIIMAFNKEYKNK
jgi:hypothetical protein